MKNLLLGLSRFLVGTLFIFSGLIKANDPVGFAIKLEEYYEIFASAGGIFSFFSSDLILHTAVFQASFICVLEVALGVLVLLGLWPRLVSWALLLMILFFTWLTGYSAVTGKVTDCGCFGDAIPLTPWQSFYKDIVLLILIGIIFSGRKRIKQLLPSVASFVLFFATTAFSIWVVNTVLKYDVFKDFRPYRVGNNIAEQMAIPEDAAQPIVEMQYVYRNKNTSKEETVKIRSDKSDFDQLTPFGDTNVWEFVERKDKIIEEGFVPKITDFAVLDEAGEDITAKVLNFDDYLIMVVSSGLDKTNKAAWAKINELQQSAEKEGVFTFGFVATGRNDIEKFRHNQQTAFPFYQGDQKVCLAIARTNPNIVLLKKGTVIAKWPWRETPTFDEMKAAYFSDRPAGVSTFLEPEVITLFNPGEAVLNKIENSIEPYNEFFLMDANGNDLTFDMLAESGPHYMVIINDLTKLTSEVFGAIQPTLKWLDEQQAHYFVVSSSSFKVLQQMKDATKLNFSYFNSDGEVLTKIIESNTGLVVIRDGSVVQTYDETAFPTPEALQSPQ